MGQLALTRQLQFGVFGWTGFCRTERLWFEIIVLNAFHATVTDLKCVAVRFYAVGSILGSGDRLVLKNIGQYIYIYIYIYIGIYMFKLLHGKIV